MPNKKVSIVLVDLRQLREFYDKGKEFRVKSLTNTTEFYIGECISKDIVNDIIMMRPQTEIKIIKS